MSYGKEYYCPKCGDMLNNQGGFDEYDDDWICTSCGARLHRDYSLEYYSVVDDESGDLSEGCGILVLLGLFVSFFLFIAHAICKLWDWIKSKFKKNPSQESNDKKKAKRKSWFLLFTCIIFGVLGIHKFIEKEIGMGFLYLFTLGLLGVGWIIDIVKYIKRITH